MKKCAEVTIYSAVLIQERIATLEKANEAATTRRKRKKKRIQKQGVLTKAEGEAIIIQKAAKQQQENERRQVAAQSGVSRQASARCTRCREPGHNSRTCKKATIDTT